MPPMSRRPDIEPGRDVLAAIELIRPIVVVETGNGRFECLSNVEVLDWFVDLLKQPRRTPLGPKIRVVVMPADPKLQALLMKVDQHVLPFLFGHLTHRRQRDEKRELRSAGIQGLSTKPGRRARHPLVRKD